MHRTLRALLSAAVAALSATTVLVGVSAGPAHAENYGSLPLTAWAYTDKANPSTPRPAPAGDYLIGSSKDASGLKHTGRAYFTFDLTELKGQVLHRLTFYTTERTVNDCSQVAPIEVWRTKPVTSTTTWQNPPKELELLDERSYGSGVICPGAYLGVDVVPAVQAALARGEKSLTLAVRIKAGREGDVGTGRTMTRAKLSYASNHAPRVSGLKLKYPDAGCGTLAKHPSAGTFMQVQATATDADPDDHPTITYAYWPVDHPDQRRESSSPSLGLSGFADGTVIAWTARADDWDDAGAWGRTCYFTVDTTAPTTTPIISSKQYPSAAYPGTGGPGVPGTFVFDAGGDTEIVGFDWDEMNGGLSEQITTNRPGGRAKVTITPSSSGRGRLKAAARDAAGNRGPFVEYQYHVRNSSPIALIDVRGVGLTSHLTLQARLPETTAFGYAVNGASEKRLPAVNGRAEDDVVFTSIGTSTVVSRAYSGTKMIGSESVQVTVTDAPRITSAQFDWTKDPIEGEPGSFTFAPGTTDVVSYVYSINGGDQQTIDANSDGRAVLNWTPNRSGSFSITVNSVDGSGHQSQPATSSFTVVALRPDVNFYVGGARIGDPIGVSVWSYLPDAVAIVHTFDGGPQITTEGKSAYFEVVATHAGDSPLTVWAKRSDGTLSPPVDEVIHIDTAPKVTSRGPFGEDAVMERPVALTFTAAQQNATTFRYKVDDGPELTVPVGADGSTTVSYDVPTGDTWFAVAVSSATADGTTSDTNTFGVQARDPGVEVFTPWPTAGGVGTTAEFGFSAWDLTEVTTKFIWHVNDGPEQEVDYDPWAWETLASYTPDQTGENILYIQREFTDGSRSPLQTVPFTVDNP